jgi:small GTP-binding protein
LNNKGLTNKQIKILKDLLRKLDYTKEELGQLENLRNILKPHYTKEELDTFGIKDYFKKLDEEWIEVSKSSWHNIIRFFINRIGKISQSSPDQTGLDFLLSKIAYDLYIKFDKTISQGQAEAVLKRALGIKLSSTGRTQLYELRKKIRKYENFIAHFRDLVKTYDFTFKVVIVGLSSEQSTKLLTMPSIPGGEGQKETLGVGFYPKALEISDKRVKLQLWDISSETRWRPYVQTYFKGANGAIIVYDKSERDSFESAKELYNELKESTSLNFSSTSIDGSGIIVDMPVLLIALSNGDNVNAGEGQSIVKDWGAFGYIELQDIESKKFENVLTSLSLGIITNYQNRLKKLPKRKFRFKIVIVGDGGVGKTSLIKRFSEGYFVINYVQSIGAQYVRFDKEFGEDKVRYLFWDIAGRETFHFLRPSFFNNSRAAIIVFSMEENELGRESFRNIEAWCNEIKLNCGNIPIIIIGNKADLMDKTKWDNSKIQDFVKKNNLLGYYLTSAKTNEGVNEAFNKIIEELYNSFKKLSL